MALESMDIGGIDRGSPSRVQRRWLPRLQSAVKGWVVVVCFIGVTYWGRRTEWRFVSANHQATEHPNGQEAVGVTFGALRPGDCCSEHHLFRCPQCRPQDAEGESPKNLVVALPLKTTYRKPPSSLARLVRLDVGSADAADRLGINAAPVWTAELTESIHAPGELQLDPRRTTKISPRVVGMAVEVRVVRGQRVRRGDVLAIIESAEIGRLKAELLKALVQFRLRSTAARDLELAGTARTEKQRRETDLALRAGEVRYAGALQSLANMQLDAESAVAGDESVDLTAAKLRRLGLPKDADDRGSSNLLPIIAPLDGTLLIADVATGEKIESTQVMFVIADVQKWIVALHLNAVDAVRVKVGSPADFQADGSSTSATGVLQSLATSADDHTRLVTARFEVDNPLGKLRGATLGVGRVVLRSAKDAVAIPTSALAVVDGWPVVFVRDRRYLDPDGTKAYYLRAVQTGMEVGGQTEILAGLKPGEAVAIQGVSLLQSEVQRAAMFQAANGGGERLTGE